MKTLSEEHKQNISKSMKMRWKRGDFDSPKIRKIWRKTALNGIAKKGKEGPNKFVPSQEMLDDFSKMGDVELSSKWGVSRQLLIRIRKRYGIMSFNKQHGTVEHKFENGQEYKWCQKEHWELVENFGRNKSRWDGLRGWCKSCEQENRSEMYDKNNGAERQRKWRATENGRKSRSATMRKVWLKRRGNFIQFDLQDEEVIYMAFNKSCAYCETPLDFNELEFDHFIPIALGGKTEPNNMIPSCPSCNRGRGGKFHKEPHAWLLQRFGPVYGQQIYDRCVKILSNL